MKNILVTGGLGFIGFNFISYVLKKYKKYRLICLDSMTYASQPIIAEKIAFLDKNHVSIYKYDIADPMVNYVFNIENIDTVVNFAAETHVDNSIEDPSAFVTSNIVGVYNLLQLCKSYNVRFHQIGTDEVYGPTTPAQHVDEKFTLLPSSPYSASKAAADMAALAYYKTYGLPVTVSRCTNNFGPYQHSEKLLPKVICNALAGKDIPVYGDGLQRRFWIHVDDHSEAVMKILENGKLGEIYNIAPPIENLVSNIAMIEMILSNLKKDMSLVKYVEDRPGHDVCYFMIADKIAEECNFNKFGRDLTKDIADLCSWYESRVKV